MKIFPESWVPDPDKKFSPFDESLIKQIVDGVLKYNHKIKFIPGENKNYKITYLSDIETPKNYFGIGFDVHRLVKNKKMYLGGLKINSKLGGHPDSTKLTNLNFSKLYFQLNFLNFQNF